MVYVSSLVLCISILLVFGFVQCEEVVGLGKHVLVNETIIELKDNTRIAENDTDLEQYRKLPGACDVTLDNDGNIILWYSKNSSTTEFGCSVDLVTKNEGQILLEFGISHSGNLSDCVTKDNLVPDNFISFSYSNKGGEFEELKDGPKTRNSTGDCSSDESAKICQRKTYCWHTTAFYSVGWMDTRSGPSRVPSYFIQLVGDENRQNIMQNNSPSMQEASFKIMIRGQEFRYASFSEEENFFNLSTKCYKKEKLGKAEEWKILDNNYINNNQNFTHLFTFHIMPIKAMRQSLQNSWASCKINGTKLGCNKEATMLKCDQMFIKFDKEHFRILVPDVLESSTLETSTDRSKTLEFSTTQNIDKTDNEDTTTDDDVEITRIPTSTEPSRMSTTTIVLIICGVVVLIFASIVCVLFCILFRREDKKEEDKQIMQDESQGSYLRSTQSTTKNSLRDSKVDVEVPPPSAVENEELKEEEKQFNDASTVVETQYHQDFNDVDTVMDTQIEPGEASSFKIGVAVPDTVVDANGVGVPGSIYKDE
uniref:Uncharacterized protein n=1 Tax=Meloidogyne incognita TaxID=6306 RepID=A0A914LH06_MELIC